MKRNYLEWFLLTAGGALVGALAVDLYRKHKAAKEAAEKKKAEAMAGKKVKAPVIAKTIFIFDVKVFEME